MSFLTKIKHISLALLVTKLSTSKVDEHLRKMHQTYRQLAHVPIETSSMFLGSLKLLYIDKCLLLLLILLPTITLQVI